MGRILTTAAAERLRTAATIAEFVHGLDDAVLDDPIHTLTWREHLLPGSVPPDWTLRQVIARAVEEARHGAQELGDEIAHADGWPR